MRIVFVNPVAEFGGAERSLLSWMAAAREAFPGAETVLVVPGEGPLAERARKAGAVVEVLPVPAAVARLGDSAVRLGGRLRSTAALACGGLGAAPAVVRYVRRLRAAVARLRPDLVHSNGIKTHLALAGFGRRRPGRAGVADVPVVWHLHDFVGRRPLAARALRWASGHASAAVAVSEAVAADARAAVPGTPVHVVHNVADLGSFWPAPGRGALLDELAGLPPAMAGTVRVALVATYARWKGQDVFIEAAARARSAAAGRPLRFYVVGGPIYRTTGSQFSRGELRAMASRLGVAADVGFVDLRDDPADVYRAADVVVHASTEPEPFGLTVVEAMACGRPTVVARAGGAAELFTDGHDAVGVPPGDAAALAAAIVRLASDEGARRRLGENARRTVLARFNPATLPARVADVYGPLLAQGRR